MRCKLFDLLLKTKETTKLLKALTDKEIVLLIAEKELTGELVSWKAIPAANPGLPIAKGA